MAISSWSLVRVYGTWTDHQGMLLAGNYKIKVPTRLTNSADDIIIPAGVFASGTLNTTAGVPSLSVLCPSTDDPDIQQDGWLLEVEVTFTFGLAGEKYVIEVPIANRPLEDGGNGLGVNLRTIALTSQLPPQVAMYGVGVAGGLATLSEDGLAVLDADGNPIEPFVTWDALADKPAVVAAGADAAAARMAIDAASKSAAPVSLADYGVLPSASASANVAGFAAAAASSNTNFVLPAGTYSVQLTEGGALMNFVSKKGVRVIGDGAILSDTTTYTNNGPLTSMFLFNGCQDVEVRGIEYAGPVLGSPGTLLGYQGATFVRAINGCDGARVDAKLTNLRYGVQVGNYSTPSEGYNRNFVVKLRTSFCGYPVAAYLADNLTLDIDADNIHRGAYLAGVDGVRGNVRWSNQYIADVVCLITDAKTGTLTSRGSSNIDLTSTDKGSTVNTVTSTMCAGITLSRVDPCAFRNIKVRVAAKSTDTVSRYTGGFTIVSGAKVLNPTDYAFNWEPTVILDNIEISGVMDQSAMTLSGNVASGGVYAITFDTSTAHAATVRNLKVTNFVHLPSSGNTRSSYLHIPGGLGTVLDNVHAPGADLNIYTANSGEITLRDSKVRALAAAGSPVTMVRSVAATMDTTTAPKLFDSSVHGAGPQMVTKHTTLTLSGASQTWSGAIPQGAVVLAVQSRVNTTITGASGYSIGVSGDTTRYGNFLALASGTTSGPRSNAATENFPRIYLSATDLVVTANGSNFTAGEVRLMLTYLIFPNLTS